MPAVMEMDVEFCETLDNGIDELDNGIDEFVNRNPGYVNFSCEFCGIYTASKPCCQDCNAWEE